MAFFGDIGVSPSGELEAPGTLSGMTGFGPLGDRILYTVVDVVNNTGNYPTFSRLGTGTTQGSISHRAEATGSTALGARVDLAGGSTNVTTPVGGTRTPGRHVLWTQAYNGLSTIETGVDTPLVRSTRTATVGTGMEDTPPLYLSAASETTGVYTVAFNSYHDEATRSRIIRRLIDIYEIPLTTEDWLLTTRARDSVTLHVLPAPTYVRLYYQLRDSTLSAPPVPTTNPPAVPWTTSEPIYTAGSTQTLYTVMVTAYGPSVFEYGPVQVSSSYEAAKQAYNLAYTANGNANTALTSANNKNKITYSTSDPSGSGTLQGDLWYKLVGNGVVGMWTWTGSAWQSRTLEHQVVSTIDAGKISTGTLNAARIATNSLDVNKLLVTDFEELIPNPWFTPNSQPITSGTVLAKDAAEVPQTGIPAAADYVLKITSRDNQPFGSYGVITGRPGDRFRLEAWVMPGPETIRPFAHYLYRLATPTSSVSAFTSGGSTPPSVTSWTKVVWEYEVPAGGLGAGYNYIRPFLQINNTSGDTTAQLTWYVTGWSMRRMSTAELIVDGSVTATKVAAGSISTDKLSVGAITDSLLLNGGFEEDLIGWTVTSAGGTNGSATITTNSAQIRSGNKALALKRGSSNVQVTQTDVNQIPVSSEQKYRIAANVKSSATLSSGFYIRVYWYTQTGTAASTAYTDAVNNIASNASWDEKSGIVTPPANAKYARVSFINASGTSTMYVDDVSVRALLPGSVIVNGSVTALQMATDTITAESGVIANAAITNAMINDVNAVKINAGFLAAARIESGTITAKKLSVGASMDDLAANGSFEDGLEGWEVISSPADPDLSTPAGVGGVANINTARAADGAKSVDLVRNAAATLTFAQTADSYIPVTVSDPTISTNYYVGLQAFSPGTASPAGSLEIRVYWYLANKTTPASAPISSIGVSPELPADQWISVQGQVAAPADANWGRVVVTNSRTSSTITIDAIRVRNVIGATYIADGSIVTDKIFAQAITTDKIAARAITGEKIEVQSIDATHIVAGSITTNHISSDFGETLNLTGNGAINLLVNDITTVTDAATGAQTQINDLKAYYRFQGDAAIIGKTGSKFELRLANDKIEFQENGQSIASWDSGRMFVKRFEGEEVLLGNHMLQKYATGTIVRATNSGS